MADDLTNRSIASATPKFLKGVTDAVAKELVEYWFLDQNDCIEYDQSGRGQEWRFRARRGTPIGYTGLEGKTFAARNDFEVASLAYRGMADGFMISWQELEECKDKEAVFNLGEEVMDNLEADIFDRLCTDFYGDGTSLSSKTIHGLEASISTSATYAGISQSSVSAWQAQVIDATGFASKPLDFLLSLKIACAKGEKGGKSRNRIKIFLTDDDTYMKVMNHVTAMQMFIRDEEMAKAGFENVMVHGVPLTWSEYAPDAKVYGLNPKKIKFKATTKSMFKFKSDWTIGLPLAYLTIVVSHFNLFNMNPRASGKLTNTDL